ncbi:hypothetical protein OQX61_02285 [Pedobacter sp. PLR]|uniref:hypothetical protein n=1 Tax=Pedobacter sp. PLR TaxID=2994465 RepID=UPI002245CDB5|nr:hypothetical protein [Pedobacter sp. PLR]MCX2450088.1 hypothetical protein [Pedobacter sp. PLR]
MQEKTINYSPLLLCALLMLGMLVGCKKDNDIPSEPKPPVLSMNELYQSAILDAMVADSAEIIDTLWALTPENTALKWKTINGKPHVLLASYMRFPSSYPVGESITNSWGESWLFIPQQMKARIGSSFTAASDTTMRICQLLGLPPANERSNTHIAEIWVNPENLYRPAGSRVITTKRAGAVLSNNNPEGFGSWYNNYIVFAYYRTLSTTADFHYPWTRLGYTYDWAPKAKEVGLSEYVLQPNSAALVEKVSKVSNYFKI